MSAALLLCTWAVLQAQDKKYFLDVITELSSKKYEGRSDYGKGDRKAAAYIVKQYQTIPELKPGLAHGYLQHFTYPVNVFHKKIELSVDGRDLVPGQDFTVREFSPSINGSWPLAYIPVESHKPESLLPLLQSGKYSRTFIVVDFDLINRYYGIAPVELYRMPVAGIIMTHKKKPTFFKSRSGQLQPVPVLWTGPDFPGDARQITLRIDSRMIKEYTSANVIGRIEGIRGDSCLIIIAHYDHLGHLGKEVWYPGANDNASGVAMMLTLARHYALPENRPKHTLLFIASAAEENNLLGSEYYVENPVIPLSRTIQVIDLDMLADNGDRLFLETGPEGRKALEWLKAINSQHGFFKTLTQESLSNDSDHYPFAVRQVPALYIMVDGRAFDVYHTALDDAEHAFAVNYEKLFHLLTHFISSF